MQLLHFISSFSHLVSKVGGTCCVTWSHNHRGETLRVQGEAIGFKTATWQSEKTFMAERIFTYQQNVQKNMEPKNICIFHIAQRRRN